MLVNLERPEFDFEFRREHLLCQIHQEMRLHLQPRGSYVRSPRGDYDVTAGAALVINVCA